LTEIEEGELDPSPPPPTEMARGRSKNNKRKPTTVSRHVASAASKKPKAPKPAVMRKLNFDNMHVPVGGGAFYRNHHSGHFTFSRN